MRRKFLIGLIIGTVGFAGWLALGPLRSWRSIERVPFDPATARAVLAAARADRIAATGTTGVPTRSPAERPDSGAEPATDPNQPPPAPERDTPATSEAPVLTASESRDPDVFLILGSDETPTDPDIRADSILLLIVPGDRSSSMLVSLPRLLYVDSPCSGGPAPINVNLEGCGDVSGLDLMGVAVEDYTGLEIDHLVLFDFAGFETIIDRIGGLEVCVDHAVKTDYYLPVFLEPGCSMLDGATALVWVRSRQTLENIDGEWQLMEGAGDAARTQRQRDMVRQVIGRAGRFASPPALASLITELSDSFSLDESLGLGAALDLAWELRTLGSRPALDLIVATTGAVSPEGEFVLVPDRPFSSYLAASLD